MLHCDNMYHELNELYYVPLVRRTVTSTSAAPLFVPCIHFHLPLRWLSVAPYIAHVVIFVEMFWAISTLFEYLSQLDLSSLGRHSPTSLLDGSLILTAKCKLLTLHFKWSTCSPTVHVRQTWVSQEFELIPVLTKKMIFYEIVKNNIYKGST